MSEQVYEQLTLFPADFLANRSVSPGSEAARTMTVTSGRKCAELYGNSGPLGCLVKMCLGSSIWHSTRCLLTWTVKATKHNAFLFRLAVSTPRTNESGSPFWPTPKASSPLGGCSGARKTLQKMADAGLITEEERRSFAAGNGGKTNPQLLEWLMGYEQKFTELMPTVVASSGKAAALDRCWKPRSQVVQVEREREPERVSEQSARTSRINDPWSDWPNEPDVDRVVHGLPYRVDRIKCLGNAVVPQQFYPFFSAIAEIEKERDNAPHDA